MSRKEEQKCPNCEYENLVYIEYIDDKTFICENCYCYGTETEVDGKYIYSEIKKKNE